MSWERHRTQLKPAGQFSTPQYPSLDASPELVVSAPKDQTAILHIVHGDFTPVLAKHSKSVCEAAIRSWQSGSG
jgi:hypothetical protein